MASLAQTHVPNVCVYIYTSNAEQNRKKNEAFNSANIANAEQTLGLKKLNRATRPRQKGRKWVRERGRERREEERTRERKEHIHFNYILRALLVSNFIIVCCVCSTSQ